MLHLDGSLGFLTSASASAAGQVTTAPPLTEEDPNRIDLLLPLNPWRYLPNGNDSTVVMNTCMIGLEWELSRNSLLAGLCMDDQRNLYISVYEFGIIVRMPLDTLSVRTDIEAPMASSVASDAALNNYPGCVQLIAGNGVRAYNGDGPATQRSLNGPNDVKLDSDNTLVFVDWDS